MRYDASIDVDLYSSGDLPRRVPGRPEHPRQAVQDPRVFSNKDLRRVVPRYMKPELNVAELPARVVRMWPGGSASS